MHDMITSGSMAAAVNPGFFTQEEARATESVAAASRGGVDDHGFGDDTQDVDEEEEETRAWYDAHRQAILRPPSNASSSPSTTSTPAADETSPPEAQEGTADEPVVV
jgi:hypothetical protein